MGPEPTATAPTPPVRVLHFPPDRALGWLLLWPHEMRVEARLASLGGARPLGQWEARDTVRVDGAGELEFALATAEDEMSDLAPLSTLQPDALDQVTLNYGRFPDVALRHLRHLAGLRTLRLLDTHVSDAASSTSARTRRRSAMARCGRWHASPRCGGST